jgi:hypothetical protein
MINLETIEIRCAFVTPEELKRALESVQQRKIGECKFELPEVAWRSPPDPNLLMGFVTGGGLVALISGVLNIVAQRKVATIELHGEDGWSVKVPAGTSMGELENLAKLAQSRGVKRVDIIG